MMQARAWVALGVGVVIGGCGGSGHDDAQSGAGAISSSAPAAARDDISCTFNQFSFSATLRGANPTNAIALHGFSNADATESNFRAFQVSYFQHDDFGDADHYQIFANASGDPAHNQDPTEWVVLDFFQSGGNEGDSGSVTLGTKKGVESHAFDGQAPAGSQTPQQFCKINGALGGRGSAPGSLPSPGFSHSTTGRNDLACTFAPFGFSASLKGASPSNAVALTGFPNADPSTASFKAFKVSYFQHDDFGDAEHYQVFVNGSGDPAHNQDPTEWAVLDFFQSGGNEGDSGNVTLGTKTGVESHNFDGQAPAGQDTGKRFCKVDGVTPP
jgi:hypothetical protein